MTKSTAIITAILVALSLVLLVVWYVTGLYLVDAPLDLIVDALWWIVIAVCVVLVVRSEQKRRRAIRTIYVSPTSLYNSSTGVVPCPDPAQRPATMRRMLDSVMSTIATHSLVVTTSLKMNSASTAIWTLPNSVTNSFLRPVLTTILTIPMNIKNWRSSL